MNGSAVIDVAGLPTHVSRTRAPMWWGMVMLLAIESTVFGTLIVTYFYLAMGEPRWPPAGIEPPELLLPTINTGILLVSSLPMHLADQGVAAGNQRRLRWGLIAALALAVLFLVLKAIEYSAVPYAWDEHAYASIVWLIVGFHSAHVLALVLKTVVIALFAWRGLFNPQRSLGVQVNGLYWHFVVLVWLPLYVVLYWAPRAMV